MPTPISDYWKLDPPATMTVADLKRELAGYPFLQSSSKTRLQEIVLRARRGLISYEQRPISDLRCFATKRGLDWSDSDKKAAMVKILEQADENGTFPKFLDFPAEIRLIVAEHYMQGLVKGNEPRPAPPLAETSRLMRQEMTPLFHEMRSFTMDVNIFITADHRFSGEWPLHYFGSTEAKEFLDRGLARVLSEYRTFRVCGALYHGTLATKVTSRGEQDWEWEVKLPATGTRFEVRRVSVGNTRYPGMFEWLERSEEQLRMAVEEDLRRLLQRIADRGGPMVFTKEDFEAIPGLFNQALE